jgi:hypothetical protein
MAHSAIKVSNQCIRKQRLRKLQRILQQSCLPLAQKKQSPQFRYLLCRQLNTCILALGIYEYDDVPEDQMERHAPLYH